MATEKTWEDWCANIIKTSDQYENAIVVPLFVIERILAVTGWKPSYAKSGELLGVGMSGRFPTGETIGVVAFVAKEYAEPEEEEE